MFHKPPKGSCKRIFRYRSYKKLADEADELGYFEFDLVGGELLLQPKNYLKSLRQ